MQTPAHRARTRWPPTVQGGPVQARTSRSSACARLCTPRRSS